MTTGEPFRYCPYCGSALQRHQPTGDARPRLVCSACEMVIHQNPKPVVAAVIEKDGKVLLARRAKDLRTGRWDLPGGFVEMDETAEEALVREVREEVGCEIRLHGVLGVFREVTGAYGPSLNIHFRAAPLSDPRPTEEVSEVGWFGSEDLPPATEFAFENDLAALVRWKRLPPLEDDP
ncbi:MAG: NUDIX hydrolase [Candidatus Tectimicrobiota bacterium]